MTSKLTWRTEKRRVSDLLPNTTNPRKMSDEQLAALKRSLEKFNLVELPAVDADNRILAGHQRVKVLQLLGRDDEIIEVRVPSRKLTEEERQTYLLTSNAVHGDWDYDLLRSFDTDLLLTIGFDEITLSNLWDDHLEVEDDEFDEEAELRKIKKSTVKPGELYELGAHRLMCGDSQDENIIRNLVGDVRIDLVDTDMPYNIGLSYDSGVGAKKKYGGKTNDNKTEDEYRAFVKSLMANSIVVSKNDAHFFFWCDQRYIGLLQDLYHDLGIDSKRVCLWIKDNQNPTPQLAFNKCYEPCIYGTRGKPYLSKNLQNLNEVMNKETGTGARLIDDILDLMEIWLVKRDAAAFYEHPTQKPPSLHEKALRRCTKVGDAVLDLTAGSGSIMVACEQLKRRAFLSEVDPIFATLIINRYEKLTGKKAKTIN